MKKTIWRLVGLAATVGIGAGINYLALPAWNLQSAGLWCFLFFVFLIGAGIQWFIEYLFVRDCYDYKAKDFVSTIIGGSLTAVMLIVLIVGGLTSAKMFNANKYQKMVEITDANFEEDVNRIENTSNISIVDMETAQSVGDRTVGSIKNATWYEVDNEYNLIKYQGEQYRISSLSYGGLFKFNRARYDGIPGYVLVNTSTQEAKFVELEDGIKYSPSAYWSFDLTRHLRNQYSSYLFGTSFFEIDEEGNPYWITAVKTPTIGLFGGKTEESFIITNACTGESEEYKTEDLPEWVDHAFDLDYLMTVASYNLKYKNGYWNSKFSKTGVLNTSYSYQSGRDTDGDGDTDVRFEGYNTTITSNGDIVFYTGLTPASTAESNVGFILANPRTGVITRYTCSGAEESSAAASAESLVQDLKYVATFPTIMNVDGHETYFMLLKDKAGLVQRFALCNVENYTKVVQADTLEEALRLYRVKIGTTEYADKPQTEETLKKEGNIQNLYQAQLDGCTYYYFTLEGSTDLYMSSIKNSNKQVMLKVGTKVTIEYSKTSEEGVYKVSKIQF